MYPFARRLPDEQLYGARQPARGSPAGRLLRVAHKQPCRMRKSGGKGLGGSEQLNSSASRHAGGDKVAWVQRHVDLTVPARGAPCFELAPPQVRRIPALGRQAVKMLRAQRRRTYGGVALVRGDREEYSSTSSRVRVKLASVEAVMASSGRQPPSHAQAPSPDVMKCVERVPRRAAVPRAAGVLGGG